MEILTTVLSVTAISVTLALIIIVAEYFFNNYGECEIDINNGDKVLKVEGGSSLLTTLSGQKIFIPSACGGKQLAGCVRCRFLKGRALCCQLKNRILMRMNAEIIIGYPVRSRSKIISAF